MKYSYAYKTSDGVRHEASTEAESREAVFSTLRTKGIRPIKVVADDGSKSNGEVRGVRKRVVVALVIAAAFAGGLVAVVSNRRSSFAGDTQFESDQTRRQVIGDVAIVEKGIRSGWADVFEREGDRFFASFAIPGVKAGQRNTTVEEIERALDEHIKISQSDSLEVKQIKSMVNGIKAEARAYIAAGGSIVGYGQRLTQRQDAEIAIYNRVKDELEKLRETMTDEELEDLCEQRNDELRNLGIKPIVLQE